MGERFNFLGVFVTFFSVIGRDAQQSKNRPLALDDEGPRGGVACGPDPFDSATFRKGYAALWNGKPVTWKTFSIASAAWSYAIREIAVFHFLRKERAVSPLYRGGSFLGSGPRTEIEVQRAKCKIKEVIAVTWQFRYFDSRSSLFEFDLLRRAFLYGISMVLKGCIGWAKYTKQSQFWWYWARNEGRRGEQSQLGGEDRFRRGTNGGAARFV